MPSLFSFSSGQKLGHLHNIDERNEEQVIDFAETYVNVQETDADEVDILLAGGDPGTSRADPVEPPLDSLAVLLSGSAQKGGADEEFIVLSEQATTQMNKAVEAKKTGNMREALGAHSSAARLFHQAAVALRDKNSAMAESFLLLSRAEARAALGLKKVMKVRPNLFQESAAQKDRIRETVRGALNNQPEADLSESVFLGQPKQSAATSAPAAAAPGASPIRQVKTQGKEANPIDEMMKLERELRDMDMALELGNSIASLDTKTRMKTMDGSFMVVPPGSNSYMSSSVLMHQPVAQPNAARNTTRPVPVGTAGVRARANRVQSISTPQSRRPDVPPQIVAPAPRSNNGLESSWWGNSSVASQGASSVISLASGTGPKEDTSSSSGQQPANNKQLMRLMDSLKRLGDENAALLREVEQAEAARAEAKASKQEMKRFKQEYNKRFEMLKAMLDKFRKNYQGDWNSNSNPVLSSEFLIAASTSEQLARQDQLIRKLTADLKREKDEAKKKEVIFRRYESFYREVKAMSAQKAAQRKREQRDSTSKVSAA